MFKIEEMWTVQDIYEEMCALEARLCEVEARLDEAESAEHPTTICGGCVRDFE